jgi:hypothetical protein
MAKNVVAVEEEESEGDVQTIARANATPDTDAETPAEEAAATGKTVEEIAAERAEEEENAPIAPTQLALEGLLDKIPRSTGGRAPEEAEIRLMGGRRPINGSFAKGDHVTMVVDATIREAGDVDIDDEWGNVSKTVRVLKARQTFVRVATPEILVRRLLGLLSPAEAKALIDELGS